MKNCFFNESNTAFESLTNLFDIFWPLCSSTYNMRLNIKKELDSNPNISNSALADKYSKTAKIHGVNYIKNFYKKSWEEQTTELAFLLLSEACALFEGWLSDIINNHFPILGTSNNSINSKQTSERIKKLQFPSQFSNEITAICSSRSLFMESNIYPKTSILKRRDFPKMQSFLICYRVFKEIRNSHIHNGNRITQNLLDAYSDYCTLITSNRILGVKRLPSFRIGTLLDKVELKLDEAVFATEIILKIILSYDSELTKTKAAEEILKTRIRRSCVYGRMLSSDRSKRKNQIKIIFTKYALTPEPVDTDVAGLFLKREGIVFY